MTTNHLDSIDIESPNATDNALAASLADQFRASNESAAQQVQVRPTNGEPNETRITFRATVGEEEIVHVAKMGAKDVARLAPAEYKAVFRQVCLSAGEAIGGRISASLLADEETP